MTITRRQILGSSLVALAMTSGLSSAFAADKPVLKFSSVVSENDIRAEAFNMLAEKLSDDFEIQNYFGATLVPQGSELTAIQRGTLEMGIIPPQDIANQAPEWSIVTAAYLFADTDHMLDVMAGEVGQELDQIAADKLGLKILGPVYFGTRQVNLKPEKQIMTPEDLKGMTIRMPGGDAWQFLGEAIGANPTPLAYSEVYTGLQTGAIDGQDNPLPNDYNMKFYEVTNQIVLTNHLIGFDLLTLKLDIWNEMTPEQQDRFQTAANEIIDWSTQKHLAREEELVQFFKDEGLAVYEPDRAAFRDYAQAKYLASDFAESWIPGMLDKINATAGN
ncbi:Sialic acid-binding periplasmic protein SiaP precursor [Aquimixticola soesokkakensis]|uniref:Sialic acid-binding periplasmic protein SiaP n=1 Tax=Aquimixticola soesokkakensis TaxID=1519096 RepID=A0A1Y5TMD8_9RHOB|nr:TRAP transporter substrate-binding protein DctP [Aquimixticola soesokkakensis]SLN63733.1 Sialic acid-binding periplasmic protein SiaP precursor [Aquimixticola soesokkakensis]